MVKTNTPRVECPTSTFLKALPKTCKGRPDGKSSASTYFKLILRIGPESAKFYVIPRLRGQV
jgi:hypothetical protein